MNHDYERAVLGAVLSGHRMADLDLTGDDFDQPYHGWIWQAAQRVHASGGNPDPLTVRSALGDQVGKLPGGPVYLTDLVADAPVIASTAHYAAQVRADAVRRRIGDAARSLVQLADSDQDPTELIADARHRIDALTATGSSRFRRIAEVLPEAIDIAQNGHGVGVSTPWPDLDRLLRGLHPGRLYVIGARPGIGKSLAGVNLAAHVCRNGAAAYLASLEMSAVEVTQRCLAAAARVDLGRLDSGGLDDQAWAKISDASAMLNDRLILVNDDPGQTVASIRADAQDAARQHRLGLVVVDYLQLIRATDRKVAREQQVAESSRAMKRLARELNVPVVALVQVNRAATARKDSRPTEADLRESGSIEADADAVILLHTDTEIPHLVEVIVAKNRHGPKGQAELAMWGHYARLESVSKESA